MTETIKTECKFCSIPSMLVVLNQYETSYNPTNIMIKEARNKQHKTDTERFRVDISKAVYINRVCCCDYCGKTGIYPQLLKTTITFIDTLLER
jgi:hypothetical protein